MAIIRWRQRGHCVDAMVDGKTAGTLQQWPDGNWILSDRTLAMYPTLYGIGPRALSTWQQKLGAMIRQHQPRTGAERNDATDDECSAPPGKRCSDAEWAAATARAIASGRLRAGTHPRGGRVTPIRERADGRQSAMD